VTFVAVAFQMLFTEMLMMRWAMVSLV